VIEDNRKLSPRARTFVDWVVVVAVALLVAFLVRTFVLQQFRVEGSSMYSTLEDGDRVFVNKLSYRLGDPSRGDVVVLHEVSGASDDDLIKRVIAVAGETVEMSDCRVNVDGRALTEPYLDSDVVTLDRCGENFEPVLVPDGHVWVMGDNRGASDDSRRLGPIDEDELVGRAFVVFWPTSNWRWL
jgi:signal peptidase I